MRTIYQVKDLYLKAPWYRAITPAGTKNMFSTNDREFHRRHRKLLSGPLSETSLATMLPLIEARVDLAIQRMKEEMKSDRRVADVFKWWVFMATDVIGSLTFGSSFRMLEQGKKNQYILDLEAAAIAGALRSTFPILVRISNYVPIPLFERAAKSGTNARKYGMESLQRYRDMVNADPVNVQRTLLTNVFKAEEDETLSMEEMRDVAQGFIVAGTDTTANTLTFLTWSVCKDPSVRQTLVDELVTLPADYSHDDLKALPYLNNVIQETLRLYASVPGLLPRSVPPEGAELGGYWFAGGTVVASQAYTLHRDPRIYLDPLGFNPSRWENPSKDMRDAFFAWGGGSRVCLGLHLARLELRLGAARFFRAFPQAHISTLEGMCDDDMEQKIYFLMSPKNKRCLVELW